MRKVASALAVVVWSAIGNVAGALVCYSCATVHLGESKFFGGTSASSVPRPTHVSIGCCGDGLGADMLVQCDDYCFYGTFRYPTEPEPIFGVWRGCHKPVADKPIMNGVKLTNECKNATAGEQGESPILPTRIQTCTCDQDRCGKTTHSIEATCGYIKTSTYSTQTPTHTPPTTSTKGAAALASCRAALSALLLAVVLARVA